jgi:hypothetical protein
MLTVTVTTKLYFALLAQDGHEWAREDRQVPSGQTSRFRHMLEALAK